MLVPVKYPQRSEVKFLGWNEIKLKPVIRKQNNFNFWSILQLEGNWNKIILIFEVFYSWKGIEDSLHNNYIINLFRLPPFLSTSLI